MLKRRVLLSSLVLLFMINVQGNPLFIEGIPSLEKNMVPGIGAFPEGESRCDGRQDPAGQKAKWEELMAKSADLARQGKYDEALPVALEAVRAAAATFGSTHSNVATSLNDLAQLYHKLGKYTEAELLLRRALAIYEKALGPDHLYLATSMNNLAKLYYDQGKYAEAEPLYRRGLEITEKVRGPEHPDVGSSLNDLATLYMTQGRYAEAEPLFKRCLTIKEKTYGPDDPHLATTLNNLAALYDQQGKYAEAEPLYLRSLTIREKAYGPDHPDVADSLNNLAVLYYEQGKYAEAEPLFKRTLAIYEKILGPEHPDLANGLNNLAELYRKRGRYADAMPLYQRSLAIREKALGPNHPDVAVSLITLAQLFEDQGNYAGAEPLLTRALAIREKALGPDTPSVAVILSSIASLYRKQGQYAQAEPLYNRSLTINEKALGPDHPAVANSLNSLAALYDEQGKYAEEEPLYKRSLAIREKALGPGHPDVATGLNNLAALYDRQGRYAEAEPLYRRALAIDERAFGPEHPVLASDLSDLAVLYWSQGKYSEAEPLYKRSLAIREKTLGPDHPDVALGLNNLAALYMSRGKYSEAAPLHKRSLAIREKALGPDHPDVAQSLNNLAELYIRLGNYADAEPLLKRSLAIREKALGQGHTDVAISLNSLASLYVRQGKYAEAEPLLKRSLEIYEKALGPDHRDVASILSSLAALYWSQGKYAEAEPFFERGLQNLSRQFEYSFTYMTEKDRLQFLDTVKSYFPAYLSFSYAYRQEDPALVGKMYDVVLWQKGLVVSSVAALRAKIEASGDKDALALLERLTAKKAQLAKLLTAQPTDREVWRRSVARLEDEANDLEKELVRRSTALAEEKKLARLTWRDVQKALKSGEAAVEIVRFRVHDGKKWTDRTEYVALILTPETTAAPMLVSIGEAKKLEGTPLREYRRLVGPDKPRALSARASFYEAFWKPLEPAFGGAKRVYFSPDGALSQVSLAVLPRSDGRLLVDDYDLRIVSSTKDLLRERHPSASNTAVLIGNPEFALAEVAQRTAAQSLLKTGLAEPVLMAGTGRGMRSRELGGTALPPLPGTAAELKAADSLLEKRHWSVDVFTGTNALEESVKRVRSPRLLHVATHGFFEPDQKVKDGDLTADQPSGMEDPMLRSGLYFAGADRALSGEAPAPDLEDGVLTSYEASGLNLQGTELVILSACETGRGEEAAGEGVFGLRRALQVAGAEAVLMTMWSVPDQETQELMVLFYEKWLAGKSKSAALREAQLEMRKRVKARYGEDLPLFWGAFVLVGR